LLGYYCYRAGSLDDAERIWSRLPKSNQQVRPEIEALVDEVRMEQAMQRELQQVEQEENDLVQAGVSGVHSRPLTAGDPNSSSSHWRIQTPTGPLPTRLEPTDPQTAPPPQTTHSTGAPLWNAASWAAATGPADGDHVGVVPVVTPAEPVSNTSSASDAISDGNGSSDAETSSAENAAALESTAPAAGASVGGISLVPTLDLPPEPTEASAPTAEPEAEDVPSEASSSGAHWP